MGENLTINHLSISLFTRLEAGSLLIILIGEVRWDGDIPTIVLMTGLLGSTGVLLEVPVAKNRNPYSHTSHAINSA